MIKTAIHAESVWEMDPAIFRDPQSTLEIIQCLWTGNEDHKALAFEIADGLHWHCVDYHSGQWGPRYAIMCELDYRPGACERGPEEDDSGEREGAAYVYDLLAQGAH